eukprot:GHUV01047543.1.p1 GENE.GHUV01047543.1~~GHUV01047543.1.p1  ORF type:complete len:263 (+),score=68.45 GHUV01047543.1:250-1038(+)
MLFSLHSVKFMKHAGLQSLHWLHHVSCCLIGLVQEMGRSERVSGSHIGAVSRMAYHHDAYVDPAAIFAYLVAGVLQDKHDLLKIGTILQQVCSGMMYLTDRQFMLIDLKLKEMYISTSEDGSTWTVRITNAQGLRFVGDDGKASNAKKGTPGFVSPELMTAHLSNATPDAEKAAVFGFGIIVYSVLHMGYHEPYDNLSTVIAKYKAALDPSKHLIIPVNADKALAGLFTTCTSTDPARRPSFNVIGKFLENWLDSVKAQPDE